MRRGLHFGVDSMGVPRRLRIYSETRRGNDEDYLAAQRRLELSGWLPQATCVSAGPALIGVCVCVREVLQVATSVSK